MISTISRMRISRPFRTGSISARTGKGQASTTYQTTRCFSRTTTPTRRLSACDRLLITSEGPAKSTSHPARETLSLYRPVNSASVPYCSYAWSQLLIQSGRQNYRVGPVGVHRGFGLVRRSKTIAAGFLHLESMSHRDVRAGTVKKSMATMTSR